MLSTLRSCKFSNKDELIGHLWLLYRITTKPSELCIILHAFAQIGVDMGCIRAQQMLDGALRTKKDGTSYKCWLLSSILYSTSQLPYSNESETRLAIHDIKSALADKSITYDKYVAWAWANLAATKLRIDGLAFRHNSIIKMNKEMYAYSAMKMQISTSLLLESHNKLKKDNQKFVVNPADLWTLVYNIRAAAEANDFPSYLSNMANIIEISNYPCVGSALLTMLKRKKSHNDYPALALSTLRLAAATMYDVKTFNILGSFYKEAISSAFSECATLEIVSAEICNELAIARYNYSQNEKAVREAQSQDNPCFAKSEHLFFRREIETTQKDEIKCGVAPRS